MNKYITTFHSVDTHNAHHITVQPSAHRWMHIRIEELLIQLIQVEVSLPMMFDLFMVMFNWDVDDLLLWGMHRISDRNRDYGTTSDDCGSCCQFQQFVCLDRLGNKGDTHHYECNREHSTADEWSDLHHDDCWWKICTTRTKMMIWCTRVSL